MNTFAVFAIVAVLVYTASASPCTDICNGQCAIANNACSFTGVFGDLCASQNAICLQSCAAACNCVDTCATQCGGGYATCKGDGTDVLNVLKCGMNLSVCSSTCHTTCQFNTFAGIVNSISGGGAP